MEKKDVRNALNVSAEVKRKRIAIVIVAHVILLIAALLWVYAGYIGKIPPSLYEIAVDNPLDIEVSGAVTDGYTGISGSLLSSLSGVMKPVGFLICALAMGLSLHGLIREHMIPPIAVVMLLFGVSHSYFIPYLFDELGEPTSQTERLNTNLKDYIKNGEVSGYIDMVKKESPRAAWILTESMNVEPDADMASNYIDSLRRFNDTTFALKVALGFSQTMSVAQHIESEKGNSVTSMNKLLQLKRNAAFTVLNFQYVKVDNDINEIEQFLFYRVYEAGGEFIGKDNSSYYDYLKRSFDDSNRRAQYYKDACVIFVFLYLVVMVPALAAWRNERVSRRVEKQLRIIN